MASMYSASTAVPPELVSRLLTAAMPHVAPTWPWCRHSSGAARGRPKPVGCRVTDWRLLASHVKSLKRANVLPGPPLSEAGSTRLERSRAGRNGRSSMVTSGGSAAAGGSTRACHGSTVAWHEKHRKQCPGSSPDLLWLAHRLQTKEASGALARRKEARPKPNCTFNCSLTSSALSLSTLLPPRRTNSSPIATPAVAAGLSGMTRTTRRSRSSSAPMPPGAETPKSTTNTAGRFLEEASVGRAKDSIADKYTWPLYSRSASSAASAASEASNAGLLGRASAGSATASALGASSSPPALAVLPPSSEAAAPPSVGVGSSSAGAAGHKAAWQMWRTAAR
mmetsp:Transcript_80725/g.261657  ORF Transcript_80725/g.261657 Transcript_80725/m.261657 type:complete len:337 (+) Transcript_80725:748-1758(+)